VRFDLTDLPFLNPFWWSERIDSVEGVILLQIVSEMIRLSVLLITRGRVSSMFSVGFLGIRCSKPALKPWGGLSPLSIALIQSSRT